MPSPIKPSDIKSTLPATTTPVCTRLKNLLVDFPKAVYQWFSYIYNEDGTFTEAFKDELCAVSCEGIILNGEPPPCDPNTDPDCEAQSGLLPAPRVTAGAAMRHAGGIPLVWPHVTGARSYDLYRGTTSTAVNTSGVLVATLIRKGMTWREAPNEDRNLLHMREGDNTLMLVDAHGGFLWDEGNNEHKANNVLSGGAPYYYWVRSVDMNGKAGGWSEFGGALGFSRTVPNFDTLPAATYNLLWSGETHTPVDGSGDPTLNAKTYLRVTLRSGGGAGGGGGDYVLPVYKKFFMTSIDHNNTTGETTVVVSPNDHGLKAGWKVTLEGNTQNTAWNRKFTVEEITNESNSFKLTRSECAGLGSPYGSPVGASGTLPDDALVSHHGTVYATDQKMPVKVVGGGGGAGGVLQAVFAISAIFSVRVRTYDVSGGLVDYTSGSLQDLGPDKSRKDDPTNLSHLKGGGIDEHGYDYPINQGGRGRNDSSATVGDGTGPPTPGEPASGDKHATVAPYITVLEVSEDNPSGAQDWNPILWVSDGEGGGYRNAGSGSNHSTGGQTCKAIYWDESVFGGNSAASALADRDVFKAVTQGGYTKAQYGYKNFSGSSGSVALRTAALNSKGILLYKGSDGTDGANTMQTGQGGHIWDGVKPKGLARNMGPLGIKEPNYHLSFGRSANAFDLLSPGSGASGNYGTGDEEWGKQAWGGHALAGCAYITCSTTAYDAA